MDVSNGVQENLLECLQGVQYTLPERFRVVYKYLMGPIQYPPVSRADFSLTLNHSNPRDT